MIVKRLKLENWRNFKQLDIELRDQTYVLGANASGKSNLLDVFRFLREISKPQGGGLQAAVVQRGGLTGLRCLHARKPPDVRIEVEFADSSDDPLPTWRYTVAFTSEGKGRQRVLISNEQVWQGTKKILNRPNEDDRKDPALLTETHLENMQTNAAFRQVSEFFQRITYLHLVPQLLKYTDEIGGRRLENDPFGQGFLEDIARTPPRTRDAWLRRIEEGLAKAVPRFDGLRFVKDEVSGRPHLEARYTHHRPKAGWQREHVFSDGTLRLIALLWSLLKGSGLLLLEEPELSLNSRIVSQIPIILQQIVRGSKRDRQILISTHSEALLQNNGIDGRSMIMLEASSEGSRARSITADEAAALRSGLSPAEVLLAQVGPDRISDLARL